MLQNDFHGKDVISLPKKRKKNYLSTIITVFVLCVALIIIAVMGVSALLTMLAKSPFITQAPETEPKEPVITQPIETDPPETEEPAVTQPVESAPPVTEPPRSYTTLTVDKASAGKGPLVLVNADHEYTFPKQNIINLYGNKSRSYSLANSSMQLDEEAIAALNAMMDAFKEETGLTDVMVRTAYRDFDTQMSLYSDYVAQHGLTYASAYVAMGGFSDHNTGYGFDLSVYSASKGAQTLDSNEAYQWIYDHCHRYGFVRRFPADKYSLTGINGETYHFRYVGTGHAYYMTKHGLCLEEYIEELKKYPFAGEHLTFSDDVGEKWEVYYVPAAEDTTEINIPDDVVYTLSGTNDGGFAVALLNP